jgi:hypothetical protein
MEGGKERADLIVNVPAAGGFAEGGYTGAGAAEVGDVGVEPLEGEMLESS